MNGSITPYLIELTTWQQNHNYLYRWMKVMNVADYLVSKSPSKAIEKMALEHVYTNYFFDRLVNCKSLVVWLICMYPRKERQTKLE
jgi:hypothetical protein